MNKAKILITGGNGLVGSRVVELLSGKYELEFINRNSGIDITDRDAVLHRIKQSDASIILHAAAKTDVDGCENDKSIDIDFQNGKVSERELINKQTAWAINVLGTRNIFDACEETGKGLIYISTDFVFDGKSTPNNGYSEEHIPDPINWYAQTKYEGELIVQGARIPWIIARIAYPYRADFPKKDFVRVFKSLLEQNKPLNLITDHICNPTFIDDIADALDILISKNIIGIFHITGSQPSSPYEEGLLVAKIFGLDESLIGTTTREKFFKDRAPRPFKLQMNNDKIQKLGVKMKTFEQGLGEVKSQMSKVKI